MTKLCTRGLGTGETVAQQPQKFSALALSVSIVLALGIWMNATMQGDDYSIMVDVPLTINVPENRAIESADLPQTIRVRFRGEGWQLFKMRLTIFDWQIAQLPRCEVNISEKFMHDGEDTVYLSRSALSQGMRIPIPVKQYDVLSDSIIVGVGTIVSKDVPVRLRQSIAMRPGFRIVGRPGVIPDSVTIQGNRRLLDSITFWDTKNLRAVDVHRNLAGSIGLDDTLQAIVRRSHEEVGYAIEVQQEAEFNVEQAPVIIVDAPEDHGFILRPAYVSVTVRGGIDDITQLNANDIRVQVKYKDLVDNQTGILTPEVIGPNNERLQILRPHPHLIRFVRQIEG